MGAEYWVLWSMLITFVIVGEGVGYIASFLGIPYTHVQKYEVWITMTAAIAVGLLVWSKL